jgi:hypothetical protein
MRDPNDPEDLAPHGWVSTFPVFRDAPAVSVRDSLTRFLPGSSQEQIVAWDESVMPLQREVDQVLQGNRLAHGYGAILEYQLPLNHRRPDILLLVGGSVLVIEAKGKVRPTQADLDQVSGYARDLGAYHELCSSRTVHAALMLTRASGRLGVHSGVHVLGPDAVDELVVELDPSSEAAIVEPRTFLRWNQYRPLPSLVRAARELFTTGSLARIKRPWLATRPALDALSVIAHRAAAERKRFLVLLTGSPGTGKTLVGLQLVHSEFLDDLTVQRSEGRPTAPAVFLSGNGPLVEVLQYELRSAGGGGRTFVRDVRSYVERYLGSPTLVPTEHVVVFDEAQRAWDAAKVASEHGSASPGSEPDHLIQFAERIPEWSVVLGLIGSGQEIHVGEEAGIDQWRVALSRANQPTDWIVVAPPDAIGAFAGLPHVEVDPALHLDRELRYHAADVVHEFVDELLRDAPLNRAHELGERLADLRFQLRLTRDLDVARTHMRSLYADNPDARYGLIASSRDVELPRFGVQNGWNATRNVRKGPWFCEGDDEPLGRSGRALRDCVTEFGCQGLELDAALVAWGTDFALVDDAWSNRYARRYQSAGSIRDALQLRRNAYRVLLTRGRDGVTVFIPPMPVLDATYARLLEAGFVLL